MRCLTLIKFRQIVLANEVYWVWRGILPSKSSNFTSDTFVFFLSAVLARSFFIFSAFLVCFWCRLHCDDFPSFPACCFNPNSDLKVFWQTSHVLEKRENYHKCMTPKTDGRITISCEKSRNFTKNGEHFSV